MRSAIQNFNEGIKTDATKQVYELYLNDFWSHSKTTPNKLIKMKPRMIEELVSDYIVHLKTKCPFEQKLGLDEFLLYMQ